jgi:hypothetical protein
VLYTEQINISNAADTNWIKTSTFVVGANTLTKIGDRILTELVAVGGNFASNKSYTCNLGFSSWTAAGGFVGGNNGISNSSTGTNPQFIITGMYEYEPSSTFSYGLSWVTGSGQSTAYASAAKTWTVANNVACEGKDGTGNAGAITLREFRVTLETY